MKTTSYSEQQTAVESINFTKVERSFLEQSGLESQSTRMPYVLVDNFPSLGLITACRFLEWAAENPAGVISLPTGKTPEYFIKWTQYLLENWYRTQGKEIRQKYGLTQSSPPELSGLHFVQIDEFYPIASEQHNSFYHYVNTFYIEGFGLDPDKAQLISADEIPLPGGRHFSEVFPDNKVDLSLRYRECKNEREKLQQKAIFMIDEWCSEYEARIREKGGIGFFLGGIGPDGHIAFNIRGSDHHSPTRLAETNFETQAVAAGDLGGIEVSGNRLVITIGLETITYDPEAVAIIFAAGEAKADMVKHALESEPTNIYPATSLQKLDKSRFYITRGAAKLLQDSTNRFYKKGEWTQEKTDQAVMRLCQKLNTYGHKLTLDDLKADPFTRLIPNLDEHTVDRVMERTFKKMKRGMKIDDDTTFLHTGPHHDDISLGILPYIIQQLQEESNDFHFSVLTSGFTSVSNGFTIDTLESVKRLLADREIQMVYYDDFFEKGYRLKLYKDIYHFLTNVAAKNEEERVRGLCHRVVRALVEIYELESLNELHESIDDVLEILRNSYDGEKNPPKIQKLKGMIREFEEELVWAHFGVKVNNIQHQRLGFYTGDIFTEQPEKDRDVAPVLEMFREIDPDVISLTMDPEGSGPDTHYKVLQTLAEAMREWSKEKDLSQLRIIGYRNVWYQFTAPEANVIIPVSLGEMDVMDDSFTNCYMSQVNASFPSYKHNGKFSELAQRTWVKQLDDVQLLMGKNYFYQHKYSQMRAAHGLIFFREMTVDEFLEEAGALQKSIEGMVV